MWDSIGESVECRVSSDKELRVKGLRVASYELKEQNLEYWNDGIMDNKTSCQLPVKFWVLSIK